MGGYQPEVELSAIGPEQARAFGRIAFSELDRILGQPYRLVRFTSAPATRTMGTAREVHQTMGLTLPLLVDPSLHEIRKGHRLLGGDEKRLRRKVETPAYHERRRQEGWDFRSGRHIINRLGLHALHGAETMREAALRVVRWYETVPPVSEEDIASGDLLVDIAVGHGLAMRFGTAMLLHGGSEEGEVGISIEEAAARYKMPNAAAFVLARSENGLWMERGFIVPPASE